MQLATGIGALRSEIEGIVEDSLSDQRTAIYVSNLLMWPPIFLGVEEIKLNLEGLHSPAEDVPYSEVLKSRMEHSRKMGDRCLTISIFYLDSLLKEYPRNFFDLGKFGYNVAAMYASYLRQDEEGQIYRNLSEHFLPSVAELSYEMGRRISRAEIPKRIVVWTPHGERLVLSGYQ